MQHQGFITGLARIQAVCLMLLISARLSAADYQATVLDLAHYVAGFPQTTPPAFTAQPVSSFVPPGANVTLTVTATGGAPLAYQWKFNGVDIPGATAATLSLTNVQAATAGNYTVTVSNAGGSVTSDVAKVELPAATGKSYADTVRADAPVGYWRLDETSGDVASDSVGQNHGAYLNGVTLGVAGAVIGDTNTPLTITAAGGQKFYRVK